MKAYVAKNFMGVFAFGEDGSLIDSMLFPAKPEEIARRMASRAPEEEMLLKRLSGYEVDRSVGNRGEAFLKEQARNLALKMNWAAGSADYNRMLSEVNIFLTKEKMKVTKGDRILMQAIGVLDEIDGTANVFSERLREWYGLYFPEAERHVSDNQKFAEVVAIGRREDMDDKALASFTKDTAGMEFSAEDIAQMQAFAKNILDLFHTRKEMEKYIGMMAKAVVPNTTSVAGPLLASRMLALAGGLERMAKMPSSTIQLLGAEKALFRHLRGGGKAPKYGILFSHPYVQQAQKEKKGKVARLVAAKISIAARTDFFSKKDHGNDFAGKLERQVRGVTSQTKL